MNRIKDHIRRKRTLQQKRRKKKSRKIRNQLMQVDPCCWFCGLTLLPRKATFDHLIPHSKGGDTSEENGVLACKECNRTKADLPADLLVCRLGRGCGILRVWDIPGSTVSIFATPTRGHDMTHNRDNIAGFNYEALEGKARQATAKQAKAIHILLKESGQRIVEIGRRLMQVRDAIGGTNFREWIKAEFEWSQATAYNYMSAAKSFGDLDCIEHFQPTALIALSRNAVPEAAVNEAIDLARAGKEVSSSRAAEILRKHSPRPGTPAKPQELSRLRGALRALSENVGQLITALQRTEIDSLVDELLDLATELRRASRDTPAESTVKPPANKRAKPPAKKRTPRRRALASAK